MPVVDTVLYSGLKSPFYGDRSLIALSCSDGSKDSRRKSKQRGSIQFMESDILP